MRSAPQRTSAAPHGPHGCFEHDKLRARIGFFGALVSLAPPKQLTFWHIAVTGLGKAVLLQRGSHPKLKHCSGAIGAEKNPTDICIDNFFFRPRSSMTFQGFIPICKNSIKNVFRKRPAQSDCFNLTRAHKTIQDQLQIFILLQLKCSCNKHAFA